VVAALVAAVVLSLFELPQALRETAAITKARNNAPYFFTFFISYLLNFFTNFTKTFY